jgi:Bacteriophage tail sheath protein
MRTAQPPDVFVAHVEADIPSGSTLGIFVTSVLLETWCAHELQWVVYERNTPPVWAQVVRHLRGYLGCLWVSEALQGANASDAFFVTCDESTMTPEDILHGHLICLVGLALVTPGEFTLCRIHIQQKKS